MRYQVRLNKIPESNKLDLKYAIVENGNKLCAIQGGFEVVMRNQYEPVRVVIEPIPGLGFEQEIGSFDGAWFTNAENHRGE